ncbi:MAG: Holliday junction resolvase RuvX [Bacteroidales bacterium]|nr:Holliday junction resolvase RuvX [Bacteroidales bacterium]
MNKKKLILEKNIETLRWLALDIGKKRTGLAVTDVLKIIASPLGYINTVDLNAYLQTYFEKENVEKIIVGYPRQMNNLPSESVKFIENKVNELKKIHKNKEFIYYDERFTSKISFQTMIDGGVKQAKRRNKGLVDQISAVLILQSYMEYVKNTEE